MIPMPDWANDLLRRTTCPFCHAQFHGADVTAVGIRKTKEKQTCFFFELECSRCKHPCLTVVASRPMDIEDFAMEVIDMMAKDDLHEGKTKKGDPIEKDEDVEAKAAEEEDSDTLPPPKVPASQPKKKKKEVTKITDAEFTKAKKAIKKAESHEDFLLMMGMTQEEIDTYKKEDGKDDKSK